MKLAWFGAKEVSGFTSCHRHWSYVGSKERPATEALLTWCHIHFLSKNHNFLCLFCISSLFDIPLYHTMSWKPEEMERVADIIVEEVLRLQN